MPIVKEMDYIQLSEFIDEQEPAYKVIHMLEKRVGIVQNKTKVRLPGQK